MIQLSYIISTKNRLSFLKITLEKLISNLQPNEEIVVVDGQSTDGSTEYLQQHFAKGNIHQFISEPDKNQAHAWNKAMLMAKGILIKKIIDDDVFCFDAINKCKEHMLQNPHIDVVISNDLSVNLNDPDKIEQHTRLPEFEKWHKGAVPSFTFGDVHLLIKRSSLAYIGLYNTSYIMMDWEYSLRISYLKANIAYYTGYNALSVTHPQTVSSLKNEQAIIEQGKRGEVFYQYAGDDKDITYWSKIKIFIGNLIFRQAPFNSYLPINDNKLSAVYDQYYQHLAELNKTGIFTFY